jgi:prepilin-type processing-associated H-X9-DG protein
MDKVLMGVTVAALTACVGLMVVPPLLVPGHGPAPKTVCLSNLKRLGNGMLDYASDNDERLPVANWMEFAQTRAKADTPLRCSELPKPGPDAYGYAMHKRMVGQQLTKLKEPDKAVMLFESTDLGRNVVGDLSLVPTPGRHSKGNMFGYADGHV